MKILTVPLSGVMMALFALTPLVAQTISWDNDAGDSAWNTTTNWTPVGVPGSSSAVQITMQPSGNLIAINTGVMSNEIASLTFESSLTGSVTIGNNTVEQLSVDGSITNLSAYNQKLVLPVTALVNATFAGGTGTNSALSFDNLTVGTNQITTTGTVNVLGNLNFGITSTSSFGEILGTVDVSGAKIQVSPNGTYTTTATLANDTGDFFQLTTGNFAGATAGSLASFNDTGLTWVSTLVQKGILFVEPSAGGTVINAAVILPIGNDSEFNPTGATTSITFNGGELLTSNDGSLDTGGVLGTAFSTNRLIGINTTGGTIAATAGTIATYNGIISNGNGTTGTLTIGDATNSGTVVFTGQNTYGGQTTITAGSTLQLGASNGTSGRPGTGNILDNGSLVMDRSDTPNDNGIVVSGSGSFTQEGTGTFTVTASDTYTGATTITAGTLQVNGSLAAGSTVGVGTAGTLSGSGTVHGNATLTGSGVIDFAGGGSIGGTLTVTGGNWNGAGTVGGQVTSSSGTLNIGSGADLTATTGLNVTGGTISSTDSTSTITGSVDYTSGTGGSFGGVIAGAGKTLTMNSGGVTLTLGGTNTYTGATTITAGTLQVNGSLAAGSVVSVGTAATLSGSGTVNGATSVTAGNVNGSGLTLTGGVTFHGTGNTLSGTETGAATVAAGAGVTQSGTLTGNVSLTNGASTVFTGSGTVGAVTLNGGGDTLTGNTTLTTSGVTVNGTTNTMNGTITGAITQNASSALAVNGTAGSDALANLATLGGAGTVGAVTLAGNNTLSSTGTLATGGITVSGTGNAISSGTVTGAITQNASSALAVNGASGSDALANLATLSGAGTVGAVTLAGNNTLSSTGTLATGGITVSGTGNAISSGTVTGAITQNATSALTVNGRAGSDALANLATLSGAGTVGAITLAGNNTLSSSGTLTTGGITVSGTGNTISNGSIAGNATINNAGVLNVGSGAAATGAVLVNNGGTLGGLGTTGAVTLNGGAAVNLSDGVIGTLTVGSLSTTAGALTFDIGGTTTATDKIASGSLTIGAGSTTINIANLGGTGQTLANGTYDLISYTGTATGSLSNLQLATTFLDGKTLSLDDVANEIELQVSAPATSYTLTAAATNSRIMVNTGSTTVTSTITNTGAAGTLTFTGLNVSTTGGSLSGGTLPISGGPLALGGGTASGTTTLTAGGTTGAVTITPTVITATNSAGTADLTATTTATVDIVTNRTESATTAALGRVMVGQTTNSVNTTISSVTGQDASLTRITLPSGTLTLAPLPNGTTITLTNAASYTFGGANDAVNSTTVGVTGSFTTAGNQSGTAVITPTGEGLAGETVNTINMGYTADAVTNRTESATSVNLGRVLVGQTTASQTTTISSVTGDDSTLTRTTLAAGSQVATGVTNGTITLTNATAYTFGGANDAVNSTTAGVTGSFTTAGNQTGTALITPTGEGLTGESVNTVGIAYSVDPVNLRTITNGAVTNLGLFHSGATVSSTVANTFSSTGANATTTSVSVAGGSGTPDSNGVTLTGVSTSFTGATSATVNGATQTLGGTITNSSGGTTTGSFSLGVTTLETGLGDTYAPVAVGYTAFVYSGQGVWNTNGGGSWGAVSATPANWTANGGTPGITPGFIDTDSATFGNVLTGGTAVVTLGGDSPSLNTITFNNTLGAGYNIAPTGGGTIKLNNGAGTAAIIDAAGSNTISAPIELDSNTSVAVARSGDTLTLSGAIDESGGPMSFSVSGPGAVILSAANSYSGGTTLSSGALEIVGSGTMGATTGTLTVSGGTLDLGATTQTVGAVAITGPGAIQDGTLTGSSYTDSAVAGTAAVSANLIGAGALNQSGGGTLVLTGTNTYSGGTTITAGTLQVGSAMALGTSFVTNSGTLETIGAQHVINVGTNYTQNPGGRLMLNLNAAPDVNGLNAANDLLNVTGTATLNGTLSLDFKFLPTKGQTFEVVETGGGILGTPGTSFSAPVVTPLGFVVTTSESMNTDDFYVTVLSTQLQLSGIPGISLTPNETNIAFYLGTPNLATSDPALYNAFLTLLSNTGAQTLPQSVAAALDQLSPEKFGNFTRSTIFNNVSLSSQQIDAYLAGLRSPQGDFLPGNGSIDSSGLTLLDPGMDPELAQMRGRLLAWNPAPFSHGLLSDVTDSSLGGIDMKEMMPSPPPPPETTPPWNVFILGSAVMAQDFSQPGLAHADTTTGAVQVGANFRVTPHLRVGALFGYGHTDADLDNIGSKATVDGYTPGAYLSFADHGWYLNALGSYGFDNFTEDRSVSFGGLSGIAHGAPSGDQIVGNLDGGYDFHVKNWTFGPTSGVQYTHLDVNAFSEDGAGPVDLSVNKQETDSLRSRLGGHVSEWFQTGTVVLTPHLDASWQHEFMDQSRGITSQFTSLGAGAGSFIIKTPNPSRDFALIDCGLDADLNGQISLFLDYLVQAGQSDYFAQSVQGGAKIGF